MERKRITVVLCVLVISQVLYSCLEKKRSSEIKLSQNELEFLKKAAEYIVFNKIDLPNLTIDSFMFCSNYDFFSMERFPSAIDSVVNLPDGLEEIINSKYFGRHSVQIENLSSYGKSSRILSFSGFSRGYVMVAYRDVGTHQRDPCSVISNHIQEFLLKITGETVSVVAESEVFLN